MLILVLALLALFLAVLLRWAVERSLTPEGEISSLREMALYLALWEGILAVSVSYVLYRLFLASEHYRNETEEFLKLLVTVLSHRFGNFLSAQKVNLELFGESPSPEAVSRLREACRAMERDLEALLRFLRSSLEETSLSAQTFSDCLKDLLRRLELQFGPRRVHLSLGKPLPPLSPELELLLFLLLENAFRHSNENIWIRTGCRQGRPYILILNDLSPQPVKGAGLGLYLARRLAERLNLELIIFQKSSRFGILLSRKVPKSSTIFSRNS